MIAQLLLILIVVAVILLAQWRLLKKASRSTRWVTYCMLAISGSIWIYITSAVQIPRPGLMLEKWLEPINPLK